MFLIREAETKDLDDLLVLSNTPGMFNIPSDRKAMADRIAFSRRSFKTKVKNPKYVFVCEDLETHHVVATSMISHQHGTIESPHFFFKIGTERRYSKKIQTGFVHGTLTLKSQTNGPSELGGLIVVEQYRNHEAKIGRQIFFSRLLFLFQNRNRFKEDLIAELLPPLNKKGHSPLWEAIGRRFTDMDYWDADALCSKNKDFIHDLFPSGKIYTTFLTSEARNSLGKVGVGTEPVLHLLKRIGFEYYNEVDPFDGGPHLRAKASKLLPIQKACSVQIKALKQECVNPVTGLIAPKKSAKGFKAIQLVGDLIRSRNGKSELVLDSNQVDLKSIFKLLNGDAKGHFDFMPYF
jgi:arginine N-succinyltransferase